MRIAGIIKDTIVNGVGIRDVIFTQGCPHRCKGCHNKQTWNANGGTEYSIEALAAELKNSRNDITISGGEPFAQQDELLSFVEYVSWKYPNKSIWIYTGYTFEELDDFALSFLSEHNVQVIVDGKYEEDKRDKALQFRGSSNQRCIDLVKTLKSGEIVSWEDTYK
jgi:anaerobic ribonucleoside-triphosphate reductase activating protein